MDSAQGPGQGSLTLQGSSASLGPQFPADLPPSGTPWLCRSPRVQGRLPVVLRAWKAEGFAMSLGHVVTVFIGHCALQDEPDSWAQLAPLRVTKPVAIRF